MEIEEWLYHDEYQHFFIGRQRQIAFVATLGRDVLSPRSFLLLLLPQIIRASYSYFTILNQMAK